MLKFFWSFVLAFQTTFRYNKRMSDTNSHLVFVYGSLKQGFGNHKHFLENQRFLGRAVTHENGYKMFSLGGFPGVIRAKNVLHVVGELYEVDSKCLAALDRLESNGRMYQRVETQIITEFDNLSTAWMYLWLGSHREYERKDKQVELVARKFQTWHDRGGW